MGRGLAQRVCLLGCEGIEDVASHREQVRTAHALVQSGRVKHIALSNFTPERMREWFETAQRLELTLPVAIQPQYNLLHRREYEEQYAPIASAGNPEQLPALMAASSVTLTDDEVAALDKASAPFA